jgi:hypothetical protein
VVTVLGKDNDVIEQYENALTPIMVTFGEYIDVSSVQF